MDQQAAPPSPTSTMHWLDITRTPGQLTCAYCGTTGVFEHAKSYRHDGETLSLHRCWNCASLIYDLHDIDAPIVATSDVMSPAAARAARYVLEAGFSSYYVAMCGLAAIADLTQAELKDCTFVDIGAGMGMASFFMKSVAGVPTLTVEPSYTGKLAQEILGLPVHRAYFEDLPEHILASLANRACLLHLNSVVEHLVDPFAVLQSMIARARVEVLAMIVPDGEWIDFTMPFVTALPFLAPRDHRHLPSARGVGLLLERLGFEHRHVQRSPGLLIATGARKPIRPPSDITLKCAESLLLEHMLRHPHPQIASGGAARLLPAAVSERNHDLLRVLRQRLNFEADPDHWRRLIAADDWDHIPYHLGPSCYWLAYDAMADSRPGGALDLLALTIAFADRIAIAHPDMAMTPLIFKWAALLLRAHIHTQVGDRAAAIASLTQILECAADRQNGPGRAYLDRAETELAKLRAEP